ncbi:MAG: hypothetical protein CK425_09755 [Parachlamydia sp.]|nr:MAG: hypothetical protein CK425_09755 [Parachlamydia sp.]
MKSLVFCLSMFMAFCLAASDAQALLPKPALPLTKDETDEIYWDTPEYTSQLEVLKASEKTQYVYHFRARNFLGDWIVPLNMMPYLEGFTEIHQQAIAKYQGREELLKLVIPTLNCLWNDVVFLSPLHPHKHYEAYTKMGFTPRKRQFFKIPIDVLKEKRTTVFKWMSYPLDDSIHDTIDSYCAIDFAKYQEMKQLPHDTEEFYRLNFDPANPDLYPPFNFYRIPHILCQDPIDLLDERITIINWEDPIVEELPAEYAANF